MNNLKNKICLIIPFSGENKNIQDLLSHLLNMSVFPNEIIIINTNSFHLNFDQSISDEFSKKNIVIKIINKLELYPGAARNIGIESTDCELIAFLDIQTIPSKDWLKNGLKMLNQDKDSQIIYGTTFYLASNYKEKIIRASTFGEKKIVTLPGTILKKKVFLKCGKFLEHIRAGEDADWILRVKLNQIRSSINNEFLQYKGLIGLNYISLLKKWYRNYSHVSNLPYMNSHLRYYYVGFIILVMMISYNWNSIMAGWKEDSVVYLPHITKISFSIISLIYIIVRGLFFPLKKKVSILFLFPINFILVSIISIFIDMTKFFAFFKKNKSVKNN